MSVDTSDLFDQWFRLADTDRDGRISGPEAVTFFQRSRLPQDTLFKIWKLVAGDNSQLTKAQFWASLRLVSLAQKHQGQLPDAEARSTLIGVGPALPPPLLLGLEVKAATGESPFTASSGLVSASTAYAGGFPQLQEHTMQQYLHLFNQLDRDKDGTVQGGECFGVFMQWGLPRQVLKDVWQVVAGDQSYLTQQQFIGCLYLMDLAKQGRPVPSQLPTGLFPPGYHSLPQQSPQPATAPSSLNLGNVQQVQHDVFSHDLPIPQLPKEAVFAAPPVKDGPSRVPQPAGRTLETLDPLQRQRLQNDAVQAATMEDDLRKAQAAGAEAAAKESFFREALQELTLFKSRTSAALLQAQEQLQSANAEAIAMEERYQSAWAAARDTQSKSTAFLEQLSQAKARKLEMSHKLDELHKDISALSSITEDQVEAEKHAVAELLKEVARLEAEKEQKVLRRDALLAGRGSLQEDYETLKADLASATATAETTERELESLVKQLEAGEDSAALQLQACLRKSAATHQVLIGHAKKHSITIPDAEEEEEEEMDGPDDFYWPQYIAVGAKDWKEDMKAPEFVEELPSEGRLLDPNLPRPTADLEAHDNGQEEKPTGKGSRILGNLAMSDGAWAAF